MYQENSPSSRRASSPVVLWLRELATRAHEELWWAGCGCGRNKRDRGFALAMAVDDRMLAPVPSQPSLPVAITPDRRRTIDISPADLDIVQARCENGLQVLGTRFHCDQMSPSGRFALLRNRLGTAFIGVELPGSTANPNVPGPHSVLTEHLIDEPGQPTRDALDQVLAFFQQKLGVTTTGD